MPYVYILFIKVDSPVLNRTSVLCTILSSVARAHKSVWVHSVRSFPQAKLDCEINNRFLFNKQSKVPLYCSNWCIINCLSTETVRKTPNVMSVTPEFQRIWNKQICDCVALRCVALRCVVSYPKL